MENKDDVKKEIGMNNEEISTIQSEVPVYQQQQKAQIDSMIATARAYPRNLRKCMDNSVVVVTMNEETAKSCGYTLNRGKGENKTVIKGPSVHLAAILAQNYGNFRAESRVNEVSDKYVSAEAVAFDLETNYAVKVEVRRKILYRDGSRYNEDMINTTGLAASAVAFRNAVLRVIPRAIVDHVYNAAQNTIVGDLSDEQKLLKSRTNWIKHFKKEYECSIEEILTVCGVKSESAIGKEQIATLIGVNQAIKDGELSVENAFERNQGENKDGEKTKEKGEQFYKEDSEGKEEKKNSDADPVKSDELPLK